MIWELGPVPRRWLYRCYWVCSVSLHVREVKPICLPAVSSAQEDRKQEKPLEPPPLAGADKPERSPASPAPPSPSPRWSRSEDSEEEDCGADGPALGPSGSDAACSRSLEEDQDELKYVREIFFS